MTEPIGKRTCAAIGLLMALNCGITLAYLLVSAPHMLLTPWLLSGEAGLATLLGIA